MTSITGGRVFLITGASRGIGLGLVRHLLDSSPYDRVIATARDLAGSTELNSLTTQFSKERLLVLPLSVACEASHNQLNEMLLAEGVDAIDVLIANAGVASKTNPVDEFFGCTPDDLDHVWKTNVLGISSRLGSLEQTTTMSGRVAYRTSKAALNMLALSFSTDPKVKQAGGKVLCMHPGWVQTDMGGSGGRKAPVTVEQSAAGITSIINQACELQISKTNATSNLDAFQSKFASDDCVFVGFDGELLGW